MGGFFIDMKDADYKMENLKLNVKTKEKTV
jgi:hypothetical protein